MEGEGQFASRILGFHQHRDIVSRKVGKVKCSSWVYILPFIELQDLTYWRVKIVPLLQGHGYWGVFWRFKGPLHNNISLIHIVWSMMYLNQYNIVAKEKGYWIQTVCVWLSNLLFTSWVTWKKFLNLMEPQFLYLQNGYNNSKDYCAWGECVTNGPILLGFGEWEEINVKFSSSRNLHWNGSNKKNTDNIGQKMVVWSECRK